MAKINIRSPYFITVSGADLTSAVLELYVYTGTQVATITTATYTVSSDAYNDSVTFEVSQLISDYLDITFNGSFDSQVVWVNYRITRYINEIIQTPDAIVQLSAFDGYGYFEDGVNPQLTDRLLQSNTTIYSYNNNYFYVPIQQDNLTRVDIKANGGVVDTQTFTPTTESTDIIRYIGYTNTTSECDSAVNYVFEDRNNYFFDGAVYSSSENLLLWSNDLTNAVWTKDATTISGEKIIASVSGNVEHGVVQNLTLSGVPSQYTFSCYGKIGELSKIAININDNIGFGNAYARFDLSDGSIIIGGFGSGSGWTLDNKSITDDGTGYYRCSITFTTNTATSIRSTILVYETNEGFIGDGVSGLFIKQIQLNEGALQSYTETTSTPATAVTDADLANNFIFENNVVVDEMLITYSDTSTQSISVVNVTESKYTPYRLTFINKFGALQSIWMFKRSDLSMDIESKDYRSYTFSGGTYDISSHQYRTLVVSGKEKISLNTGFYPESHNDIFRQLVLSEKIWIDYEGNILPVNLKGKELSFKTSLNDKLINYKLDFEFAYDKINSIY